MCRIGMKVDRLVPSHEGICEMDTTSGQRSTGREREVKRERKKKKGFHIIVTSILRFYKIYSLIQM